MHVEHLITRAVLTAHAVMSMLLPRQTPPLTLSQRKPFEELKQYRKFVTGNINGTTLIVPIPIEQARIILPKQYKFLDGASTWQKMLPGLEGDMYPLMLTAVYDHDVGSDGYGVNTNNFHRAAFEFPFVDRLNNGYSAFRWTGTMMMTANHIAIRGARLYDMSVIPSFFYPPNDAYDGDMNGRATFQAWSKAKKDENPKVELSIESWPNMDFIPYSMEFMRNITNQPTFAGDGNCDGYTRLFNTSLTKDEAFAPVPVRANIKANLSPVAAPDRPMEQKDVYGYRMSTVFLEPFEPAKCADLADFAGTGPGDSSPPAPPDELMPPQSDSSDEMR